MNLVDKMNQALVIYDKTGLTSDYEKYISLYNQWVKTWKRSPYPYED
jgi:hypothetical protein